MSVMNRLKTRTFWKQTIVDAMSLVIIAGGCHLLAPDAGPLTLSFAAMLIRWGTQIGT
jgi:hypothetical protein